MLHISNKFQHNPRYTAQKTYFNSRFSVLNSFTKVRKQIWTVFSRQIRCECYMGLVFAALSTVLLSITPSLQVIPAQIQLGPTWKYLAALTDNHHKRLYNTLQVFLKLAQSLSFHLHPSLSHTLLHSPQLFIFFSSLLWTCHSFKSSSPLIQLAVFLFSHSFGHEMEGFVVFIVFATQLNKLLAYPVGLQITFFIWVTNMPSYTLMHKHTHDYKCSEPVN